MTEIEKMLSGQIYDTVAEGLAERRTRAHALCVKYNSIAEDKEEERKKILDELLPNKKKGVYIQGPFYCDYGDYLHLGENFYANFNFTVLDCCDVYIGDNVFVGPNVSLVTPVHPLRYQQRNLRFKEDGTAYDYECAKQIVIGDNCWIATGVTIVGGVKIGGGCVIGAGSVVTRDIPDNSLAVGNPCRVIRQITEQDRIEGLPDIE